MELLGGVFRLIITCLSYIVRDGGSGGAGGGGDFGRIDGSGGTPHYYLLPQIFRPCAISVVLLDGHLLKWSLLKLSEKLRGDNEDNRIRTMGLFGVLLLRSGY